MATYLTRFTTHNEYQSYINNATLPNISCCDNDDNEVHFMENDQFNLIDHFICIDEMPMGCVEYSDEDDEHEECSEDYYDYEVSKEDYILNYFLPLIFI